LSVPDVTFSVQVLSLGDTDVFPEAMVTTESVAAAAICNGAHPH
jgi:hypothetical protein